MNHRIHGTPTEKPETWTDESYVDLFPKEKLVYLTSDSPNTLEYSPDDIYIIGASSESIIDTKQSLKYAEQQGIRHAKLPLKETIGLELDLQPNVVVPILLDYRRHRDWFYALRWIYPALFMRVLINTAYTYQQEYTYLTHRKLYPSSYETELGLMTPTKYREEYKRYMSYAPKSEIRVQSMKYSKVKEQYRKFMNMGHQYL